MKVLLVGNYAYLAQPSMQRFSRMLFDGLHRAGYQARVVRPPEVLGRLRPSEVGLGKWLGYLDRFLLFPGRLREAVRWADVVHVCDHTNAVYVPFLRNKPLVVTCHDAFGILVARGQIEGQRAGWSGRRFANAVLSGLSSTSCIVCVSEFTRDAVRQLLPGSSGPRVAVVHNGIEEFWRPVGEEAIDRIHALGVTQPFVLHVGGNQWYKNRLGVLKTFSELQKQTGLEDARLVLVGKPATQELIDFMERAELRESVVEMIDVGDVDLRALYSLSEALIFPSLAEGFGWPIIEAQACGCPVFTSDRPPMAAVAGDAGILVNPSDPSAAAATIADNWSKRAQMRTRGLENARRFGAQTMVEAYVNEYRRVFQD